MFFKKNKRELLMIAALLAVLILTPFFLKREETKKEVNQISKGAQTVRDYLDGKEVAGKDAWWIYPYGHDVDFMTYRVAIELNLEKHYVFSQLQPGNFSLVHRPEPVKEPEKK